MVNPASYYSVHKIVYTIMHSLVITDDEGILRIEKEEKNAILHKMPYAGN